MVVKMSGIKIKVKRKADKKVRYEEYEFGVTSLPNRKSPCLYKMRGAMLEPLAYFTSDQNAEEFDKIIGLMFDIFTTHHCTRRWKARG